MRAHGFGRVLFSATWALFATTSCSGGDNAGAGGGTSAATASASSGATACSGSLSACGGACVDTQVDPSHCGACDTACVSGQSCTAGRCVCPRDTLLCKGACLDTSSDDSNCGDCNNKCADFLHCNAGNCECAAGTQICGNACLDTTADDAHCGDCTTVCKSGSHCVASACTPTKIQHVVLIVQENHTFDAYFGRYCQAPTGSSPTCTVGQACCEAAPTKDKAGTAFMTLDDASNTASDPNHSRACELTEIDDGKMDLFTSGSNIESSLCASACSRPQKFALADSGTVGPYWEYASSYAIADRYFQPIVGSTSSNDMYLAISHVQFIDNKNIPKSIGSGCGDPADICLDGAPIVYDGRTTVGDLLVESGRSFSVYADGYGEARAADPVCPSIPSECPYSFYHPILQRACLYDPSDIPFQYYSQFTDDPKYMKDYGALTDDLAAGTLPSLVYVKARTYRNEHPEFSKISDGVSFVTQTVNQVLASSYAASTLILVTWDEGGGFFDHVPPPPSVDTYDDGTAVPHGTRVPLIAIGPFARKNTVSHVVMDHSSIVRFLEYNFVGPTGQLGYADAKVNNIGSLLDPATTGVHVPEAQ